MICLAEVEWTGWVFDDFGSRGLFLQGNHWGHVDLRKGYLPCSLENSRLELTG